MCFGILFFFFVSIRHPPRATRTYTRCPYTTRFRSWAVISANPGSHYRDPAWGEQLMRLAARIAINRTVAGLHFPVDSAAGALLGLTLGRYLAARCAGEIGRAHV